MDHRSWCVLICARSSFYWLILSIDVHCTRHWFTAAMINTLTCQYCDTKLNSLADLRYHLTHVRRHAVYACCGRFFKREVDYERHMGARYDHEHEFRRD